VTIVEEPGSPGGVAGSHPEDIVAAHSRPHPNLLGYLRTTSHKDIAVMYFVTSMGFFLFAGVLAVMMRAELARPGLQFFSNEQYNQLFTIHGTLCCCCSRRRWPSHSPTCSCPCRSAPRTWLSLG